MWQCYLLKRIRMEITLFVPFVVAFNYIICHRVNGKTAKWVRTKWKKRIKLKMEQLNRRRKQKQFPLQIQNWVFNDFCRDFIRASCCVLGRPNPRLPHHHRRESIPGRSFIRRSPFHLRRFWLLHFKLRNDLLHLHVHRRHSHTPSLSSLSSRPCSTLHEHFAPPFI